MRACGKANAHQNQTNFTRVHWHFSRVRCRKPFGLNFPLGNARPNAQTVHDQVTSQSAMSSARLMT
jgi:hypothetical protein